MFTEAARCRKILFESNKKDPLDVIEVYAATRINYKFNKKTR